LYFFSSNLELFNRFRIYRRKKAAFFFHWHRFTGDDEELDTGRRGVAALVIAKRHDTAMAVPATFVADPHGVRAVPMERKPRARRGRGETCCAAIKAITPTDELKFG
jgi:hypothetical protein